MPSRTGTARGNACPAAYVSDQVVTNSGVQEMDRELAPVRAQAAHVSFLQGNKTAAAAGYSTLLLQNIQSDVALHAVCTNNSLCAQTDMDSLPKVYRSQAHWHWYFIEYFSPVYFSIDNLWWC